MRILISGSSGKTGKSLIQKLLKNPDVVKIYGINRASGSMSIESCPENQRYCELYCPLENESSVRDVMKKVEVDCIVHLAATTGPNCFHNNLNSTYNILKYCPEGILFILASTKDVKNGPVSPYVASKICSETLLEMHRKAGKVRPKVLFNLDDKFPAKIYQTLIKELVHDTNLV